MTDFITLKPYRAFPSLPAAGGDALAHGVLLREIRESVEQHERRRGDPLDSFVRIRELIDVGVLAQLGDRVVAADDTIFGGSVETEFVQDTVGNILVDTSSINFTYNDSTPSITAVVIPGGVDHNLLANYVADEHVAHSGVTFTAGAGLTGGGTLAANRTFDVGAGTGITVNANDVALSASTLASLALADTAVQPARQVIAGAGLTGGGDLSADRTFDVGAGTGITVNANDVALSAATIAALSLATTAVQPGDYDAITFLTEDDETGTFPASRQLLAGTNVSFDVTTPGELTINVAALADGDKGDITVSSSGTVWTIDNAAVTFAKMQNSDGVSVLGRSANSSGVMDEITAGANDRLLRRVSNALDFGQLTDGMFASTHSLATAFTLTFPITGLAAPILLQSAVPGLAFNETGVAADNAYWRWYANGETFLGSAMNDAGSTENAWIQVDRTGAVIDQVQMPSGVWFTDGSGNADPSISVRSSNPTLHWRETDAAADNQIWYLNVRSEAFQGGIINDANSANNLWLEVQRTGATVDSVTLSSTALSFSIGVTAGVGTLLGNNSDSIMSVSTGGAGSAGDSVFRWNNSGNIAWTAGVDRSAGAQLRFTPSATIDGATVALLLSTTGVALAAGAYKTTGGHAGTGSNGHAFLDFGSGTARVGGYNDNTPAAQPLQLYCSALNIVPFGAGTLVSDGSGNITISSDERLKEDITTFDGGLEALLKIEPISYRWTEASGYDRKERYVGFSAQQVEQVLPAAVGRMRRKRLVPTKEQLGREPTIDDVTNGREDMRDDPMRTLNDRVIMAAMINAIKELSGRVRALEQP